jgi:NAD(P) transhydrogenase subunit alpha
MMGTAIGMLKPAKFLVVGCGVVGLQAAATAKRLGGVTTCVDIRPEAREEAKSLGAKIGGFEVPAELSRAVGGYASALPSEWIEKERAALAPLVEESDVVILSALVPGEVAPALVTEAMVSRMRPGSIVIDVAIDQGGNCAVTRPGEEYTLHDVTLSGVQNIPGSVPLHSTYLYANNMLNFLGNLLKDGSGQINWDDEIVKATLVTRDGLIVHKGTLKAMQCQVC